MRNLFFTLILIFISSASGLAQDISPCPKIEVTGPSEPIRPGEVITFTSNISDVLGKYKFDWSVSNGSIIEGQGTPIIRVSTSGLEDAEIKATIKITGLPENCRDQGYKIGYVRATYDPRLIDVYGKISFAKEKLRLNKAVNELKNTKNAGMVIIFYAEKKYDPKALEIRKNNIRNYLANTLKISEGRFKFAFGGFSTYKTRIFLAPKEALSGS